MEAEVARKVPTTREYSRSQERRRPQPSRRRTVSHRTYTLPFQSRHYGLFGIGFLVILAGFIALGFGSITFAPLLLVLGYCVLIPLVFLWKAAPEEEHTISDRESRQP